MADDFSRIGGLVNQAEALQRQATTLAKSSEEAQDRMLEVLTEFVEVHKGFAGQIEQMRELAGSLGQRAFEGGRAAVRAEIRGAVKDVPVIIAGALEAETAPIRTVVSQNIGAMEAARTSLLDTQKRFSGRALRSVGLAVATAIAIALIGGVGFVFWQRQAVEDARTELAALTARIDKLKPLLAEMEQKGTALDLKGVRFQTGQCEIGGPKRFRMCVAIDPGAPPFTLDGKQYRVPLGF